MIKLTKAEEDLMQVIWQLDKGLLRDIMDALPTPKPKQSTVSTVLRLLEKKGFVAHNTYGKVFEYYPVISKEAYAKFSMDGFLGKYFEGSFRQLLSFFHKQGSLSLEELDELMEEIRKQKEEAS